MSAPPAGLNARHGEVVHGGFQPPLLWVLPTGALPTVRFVAVTDGLGAMRKGASRGVKPKVIDRRYLRPDEANRLIDAARRGRYPFRDKVLLRLVYRHGLRASEA